MQVLVNGKVTHVLSSPMTGGLGPVRRLSAKTGHWTSGYYRVEADIRGMR